MSTHITGSQLGKSSTKFNMCYDLLREYVLNQDSTRIDEVGFTLGQMGYLFSNALGAIFRPPANDEMVDELVERNELIDKLQSTLLPSIKDCITSLLLSIGLQNSGTQPNPNLDLVTEITVKIDETLWRTTDAVESVSAPFEGKFTHERNLGRCKDFRSLRLHRKVRMIIIQNLCRLFESGAESMRFWELSRRHPENLEYPKEMSEWVEQTHMFANRSCRLIDQTIEWSQKTDLAILQEEWLEAEDSINGALEDLTKLASMYPRMEAMAINGPERRRTPREHIAQVARLTIPILKLTRIFLNKLSNTTPKKPMFTLDPEIDSKSLKQLSEGPSRIAELLQTLVICLVELDKQNRRINMSGNRQSSPLINIPTILESNLLLLSFHLIPLPVLRLPVDVNHPPIRNHFKPWFLNLQSQYRRAVDRMLDALFDSEPPGFDSDPE